MDYEWLIWSTEHDAWWMPGERGYTRERDQAGRYSYEDACRIVFNANKHKYNDQFPNESMIRFESECCHAPCVDGVQCLKCGADVLDKFR